MNLSPFPKLCFLGNNGRPLVGGLLFTYVAGTSTKIATYTDSTGGTPNTNPVVLDFRGECNVWLDPTLSYKFILSPSGDTDPPTHPIWTVDNISGGLSQSVIGQILYPQTTAEAAVPIVPTNYPYPSALDPRRYNTSFINSFLTDRNTALGWQAFGGATPGPLNVAIGHQALQNTVSGGGGLTNAQGNTVVGAQAMSTGTASGDFNVAVGYLSLQVSNTTYCCTAVGLRTLNAAQSGQYNTALGCDALKTLNDPGANENTAVGAKAMLNATTAVDNVAVGAGAMENATTSTFSVAVGALASFTNTIGVENVSVGGRAMELTTNASTCVAVGFSALRANQAAANVGIGHSAMINTGAGGENTAVGTEAMRNNTTGTTNTAVGRSALFSNTTGSQSTAVGKDALFSATTGGLNTACGYFAGRGTTTGGFNVYVGRQAGPGVTTGSFHTVVGDSALASLTTGGQCTAIGYNALNLATGSDNTAVGYQAGDIETTGTANTFVGNQAGHTQTAGFTNTTNLGNGANSNASNTITLGNASVATLRCQVTTITALSDVRFKKNIRPFDIPDGAIEDLSVVIYEWINEGMPPGPQVGVIAQDIDAWQEKWGVSWLALVDKSNPDRWEATPGKLLLPLLFAFQKLSARVAAIEAR